MGGLIPPRELEHKCRCILTKVSYVCTTAGYQNYGSCRCSFFARSIKGSACDTARKLLDTAKLVHERCQYFRFWKPKVHQYHPGVQALVAINGILLGAIWRISLPSRFGRDALCCDLILNASNKHTSGRKSLRIRLINVHLDSLPINPSLRPHQLSICASYLGAAGRGVIAGDFNSVLPEDDDLIRTNDLVDAWVHLHPNDPGHTWGVCGEQFFPPNRLDKVALFNLTPSGMGILQTSQLGGDETTVDLIKSVAKAHFSDHLGLWCIVEWAEDRPQPE
jgi:tyrosyl-DNA phosphodiesterase 2